MPEMDQGIKRLMLGHAQALLSYVLPGAEYLAALPTDLASAPQLVLDGLLRARYDGVECLVDLEAEARARPEIGRRLFEYGARATLVTGLPVLSVVLFLKAGGTAPASPYVMQVGAHRIGTWEYTGIELYKQDAQSFLAHGDIGLLPLAAFARDGDQDAVAERVLDEIEAKATSRAEAGELDAWFIIFSANRTNNTQFVRNLLRRRPVSDEIVTESPIYQEWVGQAEARGRTEGEESATRRAVQVMLEGRFGTLPPTLVEAITAAPMDALLAVLAHGAVESLEQLAARLGISLEK